ncbi:SRPBCC family protein [Sphingomonas sp. AOB5]|uniref:SRPBCC family protein n=1 Tax=Sphingomonas sp. AOB5 TaxID=3034017 RepID=UPI0023FA2DB8|nr:SRPBCC family protein [Sphingomonas sp. AOB5]MDF7777665.1 SRPBCC family protein [Sphingomonas sp. AOB5]
MRLLATVLAATVVITAPAAAQTVTEADGTRTMSVDAWVPATPAQVWDAVTTAEGWKSWAVPAAWYVAPDLLETSYDADAKPGGANNIQQRIFARLPGRLLVFRNAKTPPGFPHAAEFGGVTQFIELTPEDGGTRVRLTGAGYPAGAAGDTLLGFFVTGNKQTIDMLAARFGRAPLDFLTGHCWKGTLPTGEANIHCFDVANGKVRDRHEVLKDGKKVYGGETLYGWNPASRRIDYVYTGMGGGEMRGSMKPDGADLDFGTADHVGKNGARITITTRWVRVAPDAYEARDASATPGFTHNVRYTRVD